MSCPSDFASTLDHLRSLQHLSAQADATGELSTEHMALFHDSGWFRMLAPQAVGGGEWALPEVVRLEEAVSAIDGSCGWVLTLCAGAGWFAGFLPPELARSILATPQLCLAGSGALSGQAQREGEGWRLRGQWRYASGAPMATHFTFNAQLQEDGQPLLDAQQRPRSCAFVLAASQVQVLADSWHSTGLRATSSRSFAVQDVWVAPEHAFVIDTAQATATGPLYRFAFDALAWVTLTACMLGMARHFLELAQPLVARPRAPGLGPSEATQTLWRSCERSLQTLRTDFYQQLDQCWARVQQGQPLEALQHQALVNSARTLARHARECVDALYPCCGMQAADPRSEINRVWRDLHTASQHAIWQR